MNPAPVAPRALRVLLAGSAESPTTTLAAWLGEQPSLQVTAAGHAATQAIALATVVRPDVVLLDFHGLCVSASYLIALFKELTPSPAVFMLTHDASATMRRRCLAAGADAVFEKTTELDALGAALTHLLPVDATPGAA